MMSDEEYGRRMARHAQILGQLCGLNADLKARRIGPLAAGRQLRSLHREAKAIEAQVLADLPSRPARWWERFRRFAA